MVMTVCLLVYAALEYRIRTALKEHAATFPDQKGKRIQNPTARWVFHSNSRRAINPSNHADIPSSFS
jgi:transposase